jgi:chaperonin GroES
MDNRREGMNLKPLGDRVIVKPAEAEEQTASGLVIPDTAQEKPQRGEVVAVGEGKRDDDGERIPVDVAVGDVIIFGKYGGQEIKIDGVEYKILEERDVIAIVQE